MRLWAKRQPACQLVSERHYCTPNFCQTESRFAVPDCAQLPLLDEGTLYQTLFRPYQFFTDTQLLVKIKMLTGVVEVGLFCKMAKAAYFGNEVSVSFPHALHYSIFPTRSFAMSSRVSNSCP